MLLLLSPEPVDRAVALATLMAQRRLQKHQGEDELINESTPGWPVCLKVSYKICFTYLWS